MSDGRKHQDRRALLLGLAVFAGIAAVGGYWVGRKAVQGQPEAATSSMAKEPAVMSDTGGFLTALAGEWQAANERLLIKNDKGILETLRETRLDDGQVRLDQYAVAPVRYDPKQRQLLVEAPDGQWMLTLLPGPRRAKLSITYPDRRNVLYE